MTYRLTADAEDDLMSIAEFIGQDSPRDAVSYVDRLLDHCSLIAQRPLIYRLRAEWGSTVRASPFGAYLVIYDVEGDDVKILRILQAKRNISEIMRTD